MTDTLTKWMPELKQINDMFATVGVDKLDKLATVDIIRNKRLTSWLGNNYLAYLQLQSPEVGRTDVGWMPFDDEADYHTFQQDWKLAMFIPTGLCFFFMWVFLTFSPCSDKWGNSMICFSFPRLWRRSVGELHDRVGDDTDRDHIAMLNYEDTVAKSMAYEVACRALEDMDPNRTKHKGKHKGKNKGKNKDTVESNQSPSNAKPDGETNPGTVDVENATDPRTLFIGSQLTAELAYLVGREKDAHQIRYNDRLARVVLGGILSLASNTVVFWFLFSPSHMTTLISYGNMMAILYLLAMISLVFMGACLVIRGLTPATAEDEFALVRYITGRWSRVPTPNVFVRMIDWLFIPLAIATFYEGVQLTTTGYRVTYILASILFVFASTVRQFWWAILFNIMHGDLGFKGFRASEMTNPEDRHLRAWADSSPFLLASLASFMLCFPHGDIVYGLFHINDDSGWYFWLPFSMVIAMSLSMVAIAFFYIYRLIIVIRNKCGGQGTRSSISEQQDDRRNGQDDMGNKAPRSGSREVLSSGAKRVKLPRSHKQRHRARQSQQPQYLQDDTFNDESYINESYIDESYSDECDASGTDDNNNISPTSDDESASETGSETDPRVSHNRGGTKRGSLQPVSHVARGRRGGSNRPHR
jgi:hypothetical protein